MVASSQKINILKEFRLFIILTSIIIVISFVFLLASYRTYQKRDTLCSNAADILYQTPDFITYILPIAQYKIPKGATLYFDNRRDFVSVLMTFNASEWQWIIDTLPKENRELLQKELNDFRGIKL